MRRIESEIPSKDYEAIKLELASLTSWNYILIEIMLRTGARILEVVTLRSEHIDSDRCRVFITARKGSLDRWIPVNPIMKERLMALKLRLDETHGIAGDLITNDANTRMSYTRALRRHFYALCSKLFPYSCGYHPHSLRHTLAMRAFAKSKDVYQVKNILGHKNLNSTLIYLATYNRKVSLDSVMDIVD